MPDPLTSVTVSQQTPAAPGNLALPNQASATVEVTSFFVQVVCDLTQQPQPASTGVRYQVIGTRQPANSPATAVTYDDLRLDTAYSKTNGIWRCTFIDNPQ